MLKREQFYRVSKTVRLEGGVELKGNDHIIRLAEDQTDKADLVISCPPTVLLVECIEELSMEEMEWLETVKR